MTASMLCLVLVALPSFALAAKPATPCCVPANRADPFEPLNRALYGLNDALDRVLFRPVAQTYLRVLPRPVRHGVHNVLSNLNEPIVFLNDALQFRLVRAGQTAARFAGNTTLGILGIFDVAAPAGLPHHDNSFAVTLGRVGVGPGPYLFLPGLGPTTFRDLAGTGVDFFADPLRQIGHARLKQVELAQVVVGAVEARASHEDDLETLRKSATDPYATLRSVYLQASEREIEGEQKLIDSLPELPGDLPDPSAAQAKPEPAASVTPPPPAATAPVVAPSAQPATPHGNGA